MTIQSFTNKQTNKEAALTNSTKPSPLREPARPLNQLRGALGNQAFGRVIQAKLQISQPGDQYEQEADRVADQVMRMPDLAPVTLQPGGPPQISRLQRKCAECEEEEVQRQAMEGEMEKKKRKGASRPKKPPDRLLKSHPGCRRISMGCGVEEILYRSQFALTSNRASVETSARCGCIRTDGRRSRRGKSVLKPLL